MTSEQKTLRIISLVQLAIGIFYIVAGLVLNVDSKVMYYIAGAITIVTAALCFMAATDASKAQPATILLWATVVINIVSAVIGLVNKSTTGTSIGSAVVDTMLALAMIRLIKTIHSK